jgi:hypothetical protein
MNTFKVDWKKLRHAPLLPLLSRETEWSTLDVLAYLCVNLSCETGLEEINGNLLVADFWPVSSRVRPTTGHSFRWCVMREEWNRCSGSGLSYLRVRHVSGECNGDQAGAEFSSTTLFPSRPLDTNPTLYLQRGRSFGTKELWPEWPEQNAGLRVRA